MAFDTSPWETKADEAAVSGEADTLMSLAGRITGRGGELRTAINAGAMEFSAIVADPIEARNADSMTTWMSGTQATVFGSSVLTAWAGEVGTFKRALAALETKYAEGVGKIFEIGTGGPGEGAESNARIAARKNLEAELAAEATRLRAKFDADTDTRGAQLRSGPTTEVLKALVADGTMKWAAFNLWGAKGAVPLDGKDAAKLAAMLAAKLRNGEKLTRAEQEMLIGLQALAGHALWLQQNGGNLSKGELAYLKTLYDLLGKNEDGDVTPFRGDSMLLKIDGWLKGSGYSDSDQALIRGALGGGLLALSDEGIGGGFGMLPLDVRRQLDMELPESWDIPAGEGAEYFWRREFAPLAALLVGAPAALKGGMEFSGKLTLRSAEYASMLDEKEDIEPLQDLLGVASRNHEAVREVLTGGYRTERFGENTPEFVLRQLFGKNDWTDQGAAAASLIDWIPEASTGKDAYERYLAGVSSAAVIDLMTNTQKTAWGESAFQFFTDSGGRIGDATDVPMGVANPRVAQALGEVAGAYLQSFGGRDGVENASTQWGYMVSGPNGETWVGDRLQVDPDDRARFFQLIVADPKAAAQLGNDILGTMYRNTGDMVATDDAGARGSLAATSGRLLGYFDAALKNNMLDGVGAYEDVEAGDYAKTVARNQALTGALGGGIGFAFNQVNTGVSIWDNHYSAAHGGSLGGPTGGPLLRNLPVQMVQGVVSGFVPFMIDAPTAPDPNDVTMGPVVGHITPEKFDLLTKHAMVSHAIDQGRIDVKDLDPNLLDKSGTGLRDLGANEDVPRVQAELRDQLNKAGLRDLAENGQFDVYRYVKSVDDAQDSWQEYRQWRNNEKQ